MVSGTGFRVYSDLFNLDNFVQQTAVSQGKNLIIDVLKEHFARDTMYRYETDGFGFAKTPDLTDMPPDIQDKRTTRIFIGDVYRYDKRFWPAITVRHSSGRTKHISFNQEYTNKYRVDLVLDGYGGRSYVQVPSHIVVAGAWDQTFEVQIAAEDPQDREELSDILAAFFQGVVRNDLTNAGLFIRSVSISGEREEDWGNDKVFLQSLSLECYSEWRREIPHNNLVETINFCFQYGILGGNQFSTDRTILTMEDGL